MVQIVFLVMTLYSKHRLKVDWQRPFFVVSRLSKRIVMQQCFHSWAWGSDLTHQTEGFPCQAPLLTGLSGRPFSYHFVRLVRVGDIDQGRMYFRFVDWFEDLVYPKLNVSIYMPSLSRVTSSHLEPTQGPPNRKWLVSMYIWSHLVDCCSWIFVWIMFGYGYDWL